ncbi:MAG: hypothetical protein IPK27_22175 [Rhodanobacteraceae bacterium]|nr:hypothetical protein [Rhodanobacteraceae bacterium]
MNRNIHHAQLVAGGQGNQASQLPLQIAQGLVDGGELFSGDTEGSEVLHEMFSKV